VFGLLCAVELLVPMWAERPRGTDWHPEHIAERYGLFTIIVLGESVLAGSLAIEAAASGGGLGSALSGVIVGGLLIVFGMWWLYFDGAPVSLLETPQGAWTWGYGHFVVLGSAAAVGAGIAVAADFTTNHASISPLAAGMAVAVPVSCYLGSLWLLHVLAGERDATFWWIPVTVTLVLLSPLVGYAPLLIGAILTLLIAAKLVRQHRLGAAAARGEPPH
jgi:low temperature requirement protein LtrA